MPGSIPAILLSILQKLEPNSAFSASGARITSSSGTSYYGKIGKPSESEQYHGEAENLRAMYDAAPGLCPNLFAHGISGDGKPYTLSEYKILSGLSSAAAVTLARRLASELHASGSPNGKFGYQCPTYCGATRVENGWHDSWDACFGAMIGGLLDKLERKGNNTALCKLGRDVQSHAIPYLLGEHLKAQPVLLHGDLWSGNAGTENGEPIIFDPAGYYGHNEADLAIARMFGGFPSEFYEEYHRHRPKSHPEAEYDVRASLYELFHYLNHTVLFGSGYAGGATQRMTQVLKFLDNK
ncbi:hypothetical protein BOTBODRAFT_102081 [Botryobasidium botryosum FD-172 SS1]|uniref:protein-ribulosamine 3-kinase n=1 Tax=Botryobasidium botryosum (strain FD-172 SS1) TaxID=930990 RepID=A0A067MVH5_BOTB1|nr:hypothetical protein BOTBODRAFT_102081 [Botryobasidium botryosum FD-172 SS1]